MAGLEDVEVHLEPEGHRALLDPGTLLLPNTGLSVAGSKEWLPPVDIGPAGGALLQNGDVVLWCGCSGRELKG